MHESWKRTAIKTATKTCPKSATSYVLAWIVFELKHTRREVKFEQNSRQTAIKFDFVAPVEK